MTGTDDTHTDGLGQEARDLLELTARAVSYNQLGQDRREDLDSWVIAADAVAYPLDPEPVGAESHELAPLEGYFTGDWLLDEDGFTYRRAYVGSLSSTWSGGVEFIAGRAVLDDIAREQEELAKTSPPSWEWDRIKINAQTGAAHVLTTTGEVHSIEQDSAGDYVIGFGWSWCEVEETELTRGVTRVVTGAYDD